ncbi:MAG: alternative ribosome rescue aminoacyl-tRNA hydrolase ArfB [Actinomycetes bacterium]
MPEPLEVRPGFVVPEGELTWRFSRSSGPGGQSVNTTDSRASVSFDLARSPSVPAQMRLRALERLSNRLADGVLTVTVDRERSQHLNRQIARQRLLHLLHEATRAPARPRRPTRPTAGSRERRLAAKQRRSSLKRSRRLRDDD